jgi:hypothetical protein
MGISALMADRSGRSFAFENGECVECFDDCASLCLINRERYHTLTDGVLRDFDATGQAFGVGFQYSGFIELHPRVICAHRRFPFRGY